jgi:hypothetical protein
MLEEPTSSLPGPDPAATGAYAPPGSPSELAGVLDRYLADLQAGRAPDREGILAGHPGLAGVLDSCLAALDFIHRAAERPAGVPLQLGDFRIVREVGRGGMGVVYEAEQLSLRRRVALKVLRFGGPGDPEALERFRREAETVARLHHTNIVPVFAVGCEQGVHYYAMQFIDGTSLAAVLEGARREGRALDPAETARWGLQAAEALAHAHQRGVVHRDVKPSNLLLDDEGTLWLTDFGLARQAGEATLTVTGALLGTPRYMSPEQASAVRRPVDHRSDLYSLGATLYELATGRPVFEADTPQALLAQILEVEPVAPRVARPGMPRDLETVLLKCLAKEPARRYPTARALADDLRAFAEGRPVRARRPGPLERSARWLRKHRKTLGVAAAAAVVALGALAALTAGLEGYRESRQGSVALDTGGEALTATLLTEDDHPVRTPFTIPTQEPLTLAEGSYRLRLSHAGRPSETYDLLLDRDTRRRYTLDLADRAPWPPLRIAEPHTGLANGGFFETLDFGGRAGRVDLVVHENNGFRRLDGATGREVWRQEVSAQAQPKLAQAQAFAVYRGLLTTRWHDLGDTDPDPAHARLVRPAPDLDADGMRDLVWACRFGGAGLLAQSGKTGAVLWWRQAVPPADGLPPDVQPVDLGGASTVLGMPLAADVNGDGTPDVVAVFACRAAALRKTWQDQPRPLPAQTWVEAVSGRDGRVLWQCRLEERQAAGEKWPGLMSCALGEGTVGGRPVLAVVAGGRLTCLDRATGRPAGGVRDLGFEPRGTPRFLGGESPRVLALRQDDDSRLTLLALDASTGGECWRLGLGVARPDGPGVQADGSWRSTDLLVPPPEWPLVTGGNKEVVVPTGDNAGRLGVAVIEADTGRVRWRHSFGPSEVNVEPGLLTNEVFTFASPAAPAARPVALPLRLLVGPDLDGDGRPDLLAARLLRHTSSPVRRQTLLVVEALAGSDGGVLWRSLQPLPGGEQRALGALCLGEAGADGWPKLIVPHVRPGKTPDLAVFEASTGRLVQVLPEFGEPRPVDLDGDGVPDLLGFRRERHAYDAGGELRALRGAWPEAWRRLADGVPAPDLDGDGLADVLHFRGGHLDTIERQGPLTALSGGDGHVLWRSPLALEPKAVLPPRVDLDGDGVPDFLCEAGRAGLTAVSGRTGQVLWEAGGLVSDDPRAGERMLSLFVAEAGDLGQGAGVGVACACLLETKAPDPGRTHWQAWAAGLSGADGRVRWKVPLGPAVEKSSGTLPNRRGAVLADLDGDGKRDLVFWAADDDLLRDGGGARSSTLLLAVNGRDGRPLWTWTTSERPHEVVDGYTVLPTPLVADLRGTGRPEVIVQEYAPEGRAGGGSRRRSRLRALDGRTGRARDLYVGPVIDEARSSNLHLLPNVLVPPRLVRLPGGPCVCALVVEQGVAPGASGAGSVGLCLVLIDGEGGVRGRRNLGILGLDFRRTAFWVVGGEGTGEDMLVLQAGQRLLGLRGGLEREAWEVALPDDSDRNVLGVEPAGTPVVVLRGPAGDGQVGLDVRTGRPRWRCRGAGDYAGLLPTGDARPPRVLHHLGKGPVQATVCRGALEVGEDGRCKPPQGAPVAARAEEAKVYRCLPWVGEWERFAAGWGFLGFLVGGWPVLALLLAWPALALALLAAAFWQGRLAWRRRSRRRAAAAGVLLAGFGVIVAWKLRALFVPGDLMRVLTLEGLAFALPLLALLASLASWARGRRWGPIILTLGAAGVLAGVLAAGWLAYDRRTLEPWEAYDPGGWYLIGWAGAYLVGLALLLKMGMRLLLSLKP